MITAGIDIGSRTTKVVLLNENEIIASEIQSTGWKPGEAAQKVYDASLESAGLKSKDISEIIATGYGRVMLPFADSTLTEITCHARGAHFIHPKIRTIIDIGGQDSKVIKVDEFGFVEDFAMNDRCAAGTGKFLEFLAHTLDVDVSEFGNLALESTSPASISSMCTVFAESEVLSLLAENVPVTDITSGIHLAIAKRIEGLIDSVGYGDVVALTGGVAHNTGMKSQLEYLLNTQIFVPENPEFMGALGAALSA
jgi:predicted CoA-substrate-specific enzyme activase